MEHSFFIRPGINIDADTAAVACIQDDESRQAYEDAWYGRSGLAIDDLASDLETRRRGADFDIDISCFRSFSDLDDGGLCRLCHIRIKGRRQGLILISIRAGGNFVTAGSNAEN